MCLGPEACTRTDAAMTLQLYVTMVRCSQTGWIETSGLKRSLGSDGRGVGLARNPSSFHFTAGPVVSSGVVVGGGGGGGGHGRVGGAAAAAASAVNLVAAVGVVGDDSCSISPL